MDPVIYRKKLFGQRLIDWPHAKQQEILHRILTHRQLDPYLLDLTCGRMFGKTTLIVDAAQSLLNLGGDQRGLLLEPDWKTFNRSFLPQWRDMIPDSIYEIIPREQRIHWKPTGASLYYGVRAVSGSKSRTHDGGRGPNLSFVLDDEAAIGFEDQQYLNTLAAVRHPNRAGILLYMTASTPKLGSYANRVKSPGHDLIRATSFDNPHANRALLETLKSQMSDPMYEREILAIFNTLSGLIWDMVDITKPWPEGNLDVLHPSFNPEDPWFLLCDIGSATGSFVAVQPTEGTFLGRDILGGPRWVILADFCPSVDADARRAFRFMRDQFGTPAGVVAGADVQSKVGTDGRTVAYFAEKIFGHIPVYPCNERIYNGRIKHDVLGSMFRTMDGRRRLTIARDFVSFDKSSQRGIPEMLREDQWLEPDKRRPGDYLPKNKEILVQHVRDALAMGAVMLMRPPTWLLDEEEIAA